MECQALMERKVNQALASRGTQVPKVCRERKGTVGPQERGHQVHRETLAPMALLEILALLGIQGPKAKQGQENRAHQEKLDQQVRREIWDKENQELLDPVVSQDRLVNKEQGVHKERGEKKGLLVHQERQDHGGKGVPQGKVCQEPRETQDPKDHLGLMDLLVTQRFLYLAPKDQREIVARKGSQVFLEKKGNRERLVPKGKLVLKKREKKACKGKFVPLINKGYVCILPSILYEYIIFFYL